MARKMNVRIDGVNEQINSVLRAPKLLWEGNVEGIISMFSMTNL